VVAGQVMNFDALSGQAGQVAHHPHVGGRPVVFAELPDVDDVAVEHQHLRPDALEVAQQLRGVAAVGAQVHVADDGHLHPALAAGLGLGGFGGNNQDGIGHSNGHWAHAAAGWVKRPPRAGPTERRGRMAGPRWPSGANAPPPPKAERRLPNVCRA